MLYGNIKLELGYGRQNDLAQIGMLAVNVNYFKHGIGRILLLHTENIAKNLGYKRARIENLAPRDFVHPFRKIIAEWYT